MNKASDFEITRFTATASLQKYCGDDEVVTVPEGVTEIAASAFAEPEDQKGGDPRGGHMACLGGVLRVSESRMRGTSEYTAAYRERLLLPLQTLKGDRVPGRCGDDRPRRLPRMRGAKEGQDPRRAAVAQRGCLDVVLRAA